MEQFYGTYRSPIGNLYLKSDSDYLEEVSFVQFDNYAERSSEAINICTQQLDEYFDGKRQNFTIPIKIKGTQFQVAVWAALQKIPFGHTASYKDIAEQLQINKAYRAVGMANNKNKLPIIIPCHRVVGTRGNLVGYAGGLNKKKQLLDLEKHFI